MNPPSEIPPVFDLSLLVLLGMFKTRSGARRATLEGRLGPYSRIGRRYVFRRDSFIAALQAREMHPSPPPTPEDLRPRRPDLDAAFGIGTGEGEPK